MSDSASTQISLWFAVNFLMFDCLFVSLPVFFFFVYTLKDVERPLHPLQWKPGVLTTESPGKTLS